MNAPRLLLISLALAGAAAADIPHKVPLQSYSRLWNDSPFTSKPPEVGPTEEANPLEDYALCGVSPIGGGYRVTLINKKKPEERIVVDSGKTTEGFSVVSVSRKVGAPLATVVRMRSGSKTGTVAFDEKLLTPTAPAPKPTAPPKPGLVQPNQPQAPAGQVDPAQRPPRARVVPPPSPAGQQPQAMPQPQAQPQFQPQHNGGEAPRRGGGRSRFR